MLKILRLIALSFLFVAPILCDGAVLPWKIGAGLAVNNGTLAANALINPQTGTSYAFLATDGGKLVTRSNSSAMSDTLPAATTTGFGVGFSMDVENLGSGIETITPTTSTIGGASTLVIPPNMGCSLTSDGTNYQVSACSALATLSNSVAGSGTSITPSCAVDDEDNYGAMTAAGGTFTINAPTGCTAFEGQRLRIHLKFTNSQTYSFNAAYVGGTTALPTTSTGSSKGDWLAFLYDSVNSKWDYVATAPGF